MKEVEIQKEVCLWLIKLCLDTNATKLTIIQSGVFKNKKKLGDWEIKVRKLSTKPLSKKEK